MTRRALVVACALLGEAAAAPAQPPSGWARDRSSEVAARAGTERFGGAASTTRIESYNPPAGGATLWITRSEANVPAAHRDAAASTELGELVQTARRQGSVETSAFAQSVDAGRVQLEATIRWRDPATALRVTARLVIAGDADRLVSVLGECMLGVDASAPVERACVAALASLDPEIATARRLPLAIVAPHDLPLVERDGLDAAATHPVAAAPGTAAPPEARGPAGVPSRSTSAPTFDVPPRGSPPISPPPTRREADRRPVYIGGFLMVMAVVFWWNRRRRERFERDDVADGDDPDAEVRRDADRPPAHDDDDSDDLAAAARGDDPKDRP